MFTILFRSLLKYQGRIVRRFKLFSFIRYVLPMCFFLASPLTLIASQAITNKPAAVESSQKKSDSPVQVKLISEENSIQPGRPFWVGVELKMADGWDTYWINPGDAGFPTKVDWHLPSGFTAGPLHWPYPERFTSQSLVGYGYTHSVLLLAQVTPPKNMPVGQKISLEADVSWLACKEQCVPGNAHITLQLPVNAKSPQANADAQATFAEARTLLPMTLTEKEGAVTLATKTEAIVLNFQSLSNQFGEIVDALFIPEKGEVIDHGAPQDLAKDVQGFTLTIKRAHPEQSPPSEVKGVLLVSEKGSDLKRAIQVNSSVNSAGPVSASKIGQGSISLSVALAFAFIGGLILNVMPCVLPVIALKIFGFVKIAHQKRSLILKHGGVFALGVLLSFWALSGILLILRAYGQGIGWGFQLQEPVFVVILTGILFLLGLSLFGVFEMGTSLIALGNQTSSSSSSPMASSFMSGVLATLVATPCTGPLLGPALGFAMTLPPLTALSIFTSMGLGMASPYLLFSAFPSLIRFLPKPGNWMIIFKQLMGFLMMGTVVWLMWVFGAQTDSMAVFVLLASLLVIAFGAWIFGKWATPTRRKLTRMIATGLSLVIFFVGGAAAIGVAKQDRTTTEVTTVQEEGDQWISFSPEKVAALRGEGKAVFIDFTAKWCLICQANKVVLHSSEMSKAFKEKGVVTMTADWTKRDATITDALHQMGRSGVPVYVLYPADLNQSPYILPQTLTASVVNDYLNKLNTTTVHAD